MQSPTCSLAHAELRLILTRMIWNFDIRLPEGAWKENSWLDQKVYILWEKSALEVVLAERT